MFDGSKGSVPGEASSDLPSRDDGRIGDLVWPVVTLVGVTVALAVWFGMTRTEGSITAMRILANTDVIFSLAVAVVVATTVALARVLMRKTSGVPVA